MNGGNCPVPSAVWLGFVVFLGLGVLLAHSALAETYEWREEAALHDGGMIVVHWWVANGARGALQEDGWTSATDVLPSREQAASYLGGCREGGLAPEPYGTWLDKTEDEAMKLLWGDEGPPCPSRSSCLPCRSSVELSDGVCGSVLWLSTKSGRYSREAEISRVNVYRTLGDCERVLTETVTEQGKLGSRTVSHEHAEVITWLGKRGEAPMRRQKWECLPDVMDPRGVQGR